MYLLERVIIVWRGIFYLSVPMPYVSDWIFFSNNDSFLLKAQKFFWWKQILIIIFIHMSWQQSIIQICWFSAAWIVFAALKVSKPYKIAPRSFGVKTIPHICPPYVNKYAINIWAHSNILQHVVNVFFDTFFAVTKINVQQSHMLSEHEDESKKWILVKSSFKKIWTKSFASISYGTNFVI